MSGENAFGLAEIFDFFCVGQIHCRRKVQNLRLGPVVSEPILNTLLLLYVKVGEVSTLLR